MDLFDTEPPAIPNQQTPDSDGPEVVATLCRDDTPSEEKQ